MMSTKHNELPDLFPDETEESAGGNAIPHLHRSVYLPLVDRSGQVPTSSGLNWGQREGRDPDQAYLSISSAVRTQDFENFFPSVGMRFEICTDDADCFVGVRAQQDGKALQTPDDNSILGRYFRGRLGLPSGEAVNAERLHAYGRLDVGITKIGEKRYWLEFQKPSL